MKYLVLFVAIAASVNAYAQANTKLSNLASPTAVNQDLLPNAKNARSLGSAALNWKNLYMAGSIFKGKLPFLANPGKGNTFLGIQAGKSNTSGAYNTIIGDSALYSNTTAGYNTANGAFALYSNTTGISNTANGAYSLYSNTANGNNALYSSTYGAYNTADGNNALYSTTAGVHNTAVGYNALQYNTGGSQNIAIGSNSGTNPNAPNVSNTISIGNDDISNASQNQVFIGNTHIAYIGGAVTWSTYSDARIKNTIQEDVKGLDFIMRLRPVTYHISSKAVTAITGGKETPDYPGKYDAEKIKHSGFIAQEVEKAAKASGYDFSGYSAPKNQWGLYSISYAEFVVPLVKAVQELNETNNALKTKNIELEERLAKLETIVLSNSNNPVNSSSAYIKQNAPNPFTNSTVISYYTPANAQIKIIDMKGVALKTYFISKGEGQINISNAQLAAGTYNYTLYVDGKKVDTKQMIITK